MDEEGEGGKKYNYHNRKKNHNKTNLRAHIIWSKPLPLPCLRIHKNNHAHIIPQMSFSFELLVVVVVKGKICTDMKHNLVVFVGSEDRVGSRCVAPGEKEKKGEEEG